MSDSLMTPADVYVACVDTWGRPRLDPCWHPASPVRPVTAFCLPLNLLAWNLNVMNQCREIDGVNVVAGDGLDLDWGVARHGWTWLNPPYSAPGPWLQRMRRGAALVKLDPSTRWWEQTLRPGVTAIGLFNKRLKYPRTDGGKQMTANFPSAIILYNMGLRPALPVTWMRKL